MTDKDLCKIAYDALHRACKWIRENPPGDFGGYTKGQIQCLVGGCDDPEGERFVNYFIDEALEAYIQGRSTKASVTGFDPGDEGSIPSAPARDIVPEKSSTATLK